MTSPAELQAAMMAESRRLQQLIDDHPQLIREEVEATTVAGIAEASALLGTHGTVPEKQAHVRLACVEVRKTADMATGLRKSNELAIKAAMAKLSALQSLASAIREEARLARVGDGP